MGMSGEKSTSPEVSSYPDYYSIVLTVVDESVDPPVAMVKFDRASVIDELGPGTHQITISGQVGSATIIGTDQAEVIDPGQGESGEGGEEDEDERPPDDNPGRGPPDDNPGRGPPDDNPGRGPPDDNLGRGGQ